MPPRVILGTSDQRKAQRVDILNTTDWYSIRHSDQLGAGIPTTLTAQQFTDLLTYRQALRDWPKSGDYNEAFPAKPSWM
jgi:hypothetical protein